MNWTNKDEGVEDAVSMQEDTDIGRWDGNGAGESDSF